MPKFHLDKSILVNSSPDKVFRRKSDLHSVGNSFIPSADISLLNTDQFQELIGH